MTEHHFDRRIIEHLRRRKELDEKAYQHHLKSLPDSEANAEYINIEHEEIRNSALSNKASQSQSLTFTAVEDL